MFPLKTFCSTFDMSIPRLPHICWFCVTKISISSLFNLFHFCHFSCLLTTIISYFTHVTKFPSTQTLWALTIELSFSCSNKFNSNFKSFTISAQTLRAPQLSGDASYSLLQLVNSSLAFWLLNRHLQELQFLMISPNCFLKFLHDFETSSHISPEFS